MHFSSYDVFESHLCHQHVSVVTAAIFMVILLQECKIYKFY